MKYVSDHELVKQCQKGDVTAFEVLYRKYNIPLINFIYRMISDTALAEDLFHETFIRIVENIDSYNPEYRFSTWIYKIATNLCINEIKKKQRENHLFQVSGQLYDNKSIENTLSTDEKTPVELLERKEKEEYVQRLLENLPEKQRLTFLLKFYYDFTYGEIAYIEECSEGTIKSRIFYGLKTLRSKIQEEHKCIKRIK